MKKATQSPGQSVGRTTAKRIYIYGVVPNFYGTTQFQLLENSGVYAITFNNISAIVSESDGTHIEHLDRESLGYLLVHHQKTIEELQNKGFTMIIPMKLGTIVDSKDDVIKILSNGYGLIIETLKKIEYLTEIDMVVTWANFADVLKGIAQLEDVKELKKDIMKDNGVITKIDQVKMGLFLKEKIDQKNKATELKILDVLSPYGLDIKIHEVMNDEMITNSAFLLNRNKQKKFEQAIDQLDAEYNGVLNFKLVGPLPCYSYYTLEVKELNPEKLEQAKKELGLNETTSENEIKKAFLKKAKVFHPDNSDGNFDAEKFNMIQNDYHVMLDYSAAVRQSSKEDSFSLVKEKVIEHLILVKIKE
ncbi:MAG: GvpL/GvpF family gas vesicle protein [Bacteroidetes bacterium]|nr:GvpL/GvpF family gas vesicle protein [Bacteroidota bacterium]